MQNKRTLNLGPKIRYFAILSLKLGKITRICQNAKSLAKQKSFKFVTKNALFGYFWTVILKSYGYI